MLILVSCKGYAYYGLGARATALEMAKDLQMYFLSETQDTNASDFSAGHQTPKTLAIIDTNLYTEFLAAWEVLASDLTIRLNATNDPAFVKILSRARSQTLSFDGYVDSPGTRLPSCMDIGQFFVQLNLLCNIDPESSLKESLDAAQSAYNAMFVVRGVGPGTANATGMAIVWPYLSTYKNLPSFYNDYLFNASNVYATVDAPNWLNFLKTYYDTQTPQRNTTKSVCLNSIENNIQAEFADQMWLNPSVVIDSTSAVFSSEVTFETDYVQVSYGVNVTHLLSSNRRLVEMVHQQYMQFENGFTIDPDTFDPSSMRHYQNSRRRTQATELFEHKSWSKLDSYLC
jgi:hypothetical protein